MATLSISAIPSLEAVLEVDRHGVYLTVDDDPNLACLVLILGSSPSLVDRDARAQTICLRRPDLWQETG
jgi:hypothetical protein